MHYGSGSTRKWKVGDRVFSRPCWAIQGPRSIPLAGQLGQFRGHWVKQSFFHSVSVSLSHSDVVVSQLLEHNYQLWQLSDQGEWPGMLEQSYQLWQLSDQGVWQGMLEQLSTLTTVKPGCVTRNGVRDSSLLTSVFGHITSFTPFICMEDWPHFAAQYNVAKDNTNIFDLIGFFP